MEEIKNKETTDILSLNHLYCMDCMEGIKKIPDHSVDLVLTDIPYSEVSQNGEERKKYKNSLRNLDKKDADILTFDLPSFLEEITRVTRGSIYIFCGIEQMSEIFSFFKKRKKDFMVRQCAWKKTNPSPMNGQHMWLSSMENCVYAKKRKTKFYAHCSSAVWEFPVGKNKCHPTQKPVPLFEYLIKASTDEGDIVLDPLMGSGTTAVAATLQDRRWIGFEINEEYVKDARQRIKNATK